MTLFPNTNDGAVFIFVIDEFRGEQLVRQSICNAYMANQTEMTEEYVSREKNSEATISEETDKHLTFIIARFRAKTSMNCQ